MPDAVRRVHVLIRGRVQGVVFRESTRQMAGGLGLRGWVRNLHDGRVEAVFEGPAGEVDEALAWCRKGPPAARVDGLEAHDEPPRAEAPGFTVRPSAGRPEA